MRAKFITIGFLVAFLLLSVGILALPAQAGQLVQEPGPSEARLIEQLHQEPEGDVSFSYHTDPMLIANSTAITVYLPIIYVPSFEQQLIDLINAERISRGLGILSVSTILMQVAEAHSQDMVDRNFFDHVNPDGLGPGQRLTNAGYNWLTYGETIGAGQSSPQAMFDTWMASATHRVILLSPSYTEIGVGYVAGGYYGHYWTAVFATPQ